MLDQRGVPLVQFFDVVVSAHVQDVCDERRRVHGQPVPKVLDDVGAQHRIFRAAVELVERLVSDCYLVAQQGAFGHLLEVDDLFVLRRRLIHRADCENEY